MVGEVGGLRCLKRCLESLPFPIIYYHFLLAGTSYTLLGVKQEEYFVW